MNERSEAAAQKITEIKNNTQAAIAKLVNFFFEHENEKLKGQKSIETI